MLKKLKLCYEKQPIYIKINLLHSIIVCGIVVFLVIVISQVCSDILIRQKIENSVKDLSPSRKSLICSLRNMKRIRLPSF